jgi:serine/threonine-protein kinase
MKFGQYELLEPIAIGGMAEVFKGRVAGAEGFEKYVAIKRILPDLAEDERFVKMLLTEARIHSALSHRNIVQIHDLGISEQGEYFIVLEYVEGYDLRIMTEQLGKEREILPEALSLYIAAEIAEGLHFAHEMRGPDGQPLGLVHRDVTPSNILISFAGEVKLSDFGLAKRRRDRSVVGSIKGNLGYMSPEQAMQRELDRRTDVFSLGAVLFELLTGTKLRAITDEVAGWNQAASGVVPSARRLRPDLPPAIERLLDVALASEPTDRFPDAAAFGAAIREVLTQMSIPVGASDLSALLAVIKPPTRARALMMEPSKVIRLGPEAQALREMISAPATPAPMVSPGMTPASPRALNQAVVRATQRTTDPAATPLPAARPGRSPGVDPMATPPPAGKSTTPAALRAATPPATTPAATPAPPPVRRPTPPPSGQVPEPIRARAPSGPRLTPAGSAPALARATPASMPIRDAQHARSTGPRAVVAPHALQRTPAHGVRRASAPVFALPPGPTGVDRAQRETARVQLRTPPRWGRRLFTLLVLAAGGAAAVHFLFVPLDVLVTWRNPARVSIATDPSGATLRLDGATLDSTSPTAISVQRDRADHVLEAARAGYLPAHQTIRFDRSVVLSFRLELQKDASFVPPPRPTGAIAPTSASVVPVRR